jgi:flagellar biosynthesis GTPase FlhF
MAFTKEETFFDDCLIEALNNEEIQLAADKLGIDEKLLKQAANRKKEQIWETARKEISAYDELDSRYREAEKQVSLAIPRDLSARLALLILIGLLPLLFLVLGFSIGWSPLLSWIKLHPYGSVFSLFLFGVIGFVMISAITSPRHEAQAKSVRETRERQLGIADLEEQRKNLRQQIRDQMMRHGFLEELRLFMNEQTEASYGNTLSVLSQAGLAEVPDAGYYVETTAQQKLLRLLETLPGASIGLAGPRGVGKTTLLTSISQNPGTPERPFLAAFTSAPVEYDPREFILHLYSAVCRKILYPEGTVETHEPLRDLLRA